MRIKEIDMNKYLVLKTEDIKKYLTDKQKLDLSRIESTIRFGRIESGKKEWPEHLVLNLDDTIDLDYLGDNLFGDEFDEEQEIKVKDIAVPLVNAILNAKTEQRISKI